MSFITRLGARAYQAVESRVLTCPYGVGRTAQCLKAAVKTVPIVLNRVRAAGGGWGYALKNAWDGANVGLGAASIALIPADPQLGFRMAFGSLLPLFAKRIMFNGNPAAGDFSTEGSLAVTGIAAGVILSSSLTNGVACIVSGAVTALHPEAVQGYDEFPYMRVGAGMAAGAGAALFGLPPKESAVIGAVAFEAMRQAGQVHFFIFPSHFSKYEIIKTGVSAGASMAGFAVAGPWGAIGAGAAAGALVNTANTMLDDPAFYLTPIVQRFQREHATLVADLARAGTPALLVDHGMVSGANAPGPGGIIMEYIG